MALPVKCSVGQDAETIDRRHNLWNGIDARSRHGALHSDGEIRDGTIQVIRTTRQQGPGISTVRWLGMMLERA